MNLIKKIIAKFRKQSDPLSDLINSLIQDAPHRPTTGWQGSVRPSRDSDRAADGLPENFVRSIMRIRKKQILRELTETQIRLQNVERGLVRFLRELDGVIGEYVPKHAHIVTTLADFAAPHKSLTSIIGEDA